MKNIKYGVCSWMLQTDNLLQDFQSLKKMGFDGIELNFPKDYQNLVGDADLYIEKSKETGLEMPSIGLNGIGAFDPMNKPHSKEFTDYMQNAVAFAKKLNIKIIQIPAFGITEMKNSSDIEKTAVFIQSFCDIDTDLIISSENTLSKEANLELLKTVDRPNFKIYFDTQNPFMCYGYDVPSMVDDLIDNVCEIHVKDGFGEMANRNLGKGNSDFTKTIEKIKNSAYNGYVHLENNYIKMSNGDKEKAEKIMIDDLKILKNLI